MVSQFHPCAFFGRSACLFLALFILCAVGIATDFLSRGLLKQEQCSRSAVKWRRKAKRRTGRTAADAGCLPQQPDVKALLRSFYHQHDSAECRWAHGKSADSFSNGCCGSLLGYAPKEEIGHEQPVCFQEENEVPRQSCRFTSEWSDC